MPHIRATQVTPLAFGVTEWFGLIMLATAHVHCFIAVT
jgi:hypothetical protein